MLLADIVEKKCIPIKLLERRRTMIIVRDAIYKIFEKKNGQIGQLIH